MNRKERRATAKQTSARTTGAPARNADDLFAQALALEQARQLNEAAVAYKRVLAAKPDHAEAANNLGRVLLMQGRMREASAAFAKSLALAPQLFDDFRPICATVAAILPELGQAAQTVTSAWPQRPRLKELFRGAALASIAADPLLLSILRASPVRDIGFERVLTAIRAGLLEMAAEGRKPDPAILNFCAALAEQCFINEYVFAVAAAEQEIVDRLAAEIAATRGPVPPFQIAALAMYRPLHALPNAQALLAAKWPDTVDALFTQQVREPAKERQLRETIPALTAVTDDVSKRVRQQYEDNPYPRWVRAAGAAQPLPFAEYLKSSVLGEVPEANVSDSADMLVAGCGTGAHPIALARKIRGARVLAVDLSLASLAYAKRKTPADLAGHIDYAQADILKLGDLGRSFDAIDASGVLHHMAEPEAGLRVLLSLLKPGGFLRLGLYSQLARRDVQAAREYLAGQGFGSSADDIRRAREVLLQSELRSVAQSNDFYTTSECRDLLFHVQEHQLTLPQIKTMLAANGLRFLGFGFDPAASLRYAQAFAQSGKSLADLDAWHDFEAAHPATFRGMYQFWCQKPA